MPYDSIPPKLFFSSRLVTQPSLLACFSTCYLSVIQNHHSPFFKLFLLGITDHTGLLAGFRGVLDSFL